MSNYTLNKTGSEIDDIFERADKLPTLSSSDEGKTLQVDSNGDIVANTVSSSGGGGASSSGGYTLTLYAHGGGTQRIGVYVLGKYDNTFGWHYVMASYQDGGNVTKTIENVILFIPYDFNAVSNITSNSTYLYNGTNVTSNNIFNYSGNMMYITKNTTIEADD